MATKVIIDTDPGIDDSVALGLALNSPELEILAVTTVFGNTTVENSFQNACHVLQKFGSGDIPVYAGATQPLLRELVVADETHGPTGTGYLKLPKEFKPPSIQASLAILEILKKAADPVTIIALGPLTNLALALSLERELFTKKIKEIVLMGGSAGAPGNTTPVSEFNFWADPEAAKAILHSSVPIRMVGLDVTRPIVFHNSVVQKLAASSYERAAFLGELMRFYVDFHREYENLDGCIVNDPLAVAVTINPDWGGGQNMYVDVCTTDGLTRGQTICDRFGFLKKEPNVYVYLTVDAVGVMEFTMKRTVGSVITRSDLERGLQLTSA
ncbi:MAG: nucleoside hydrolase [Firmicutes bacterium]|nr:nucleoside hydrolase [Bacillota bacterium]